MPAHHLKCHLCIKCYEDDDGFLFQPKTVNLDLAAKILIGNMTVDKTENSKFKSEFKHLIHSFFRSFFVCFFKFMAYTSHSCWWREHAEAFSGLNMGNAIQNLLAMSKLSFYIWAANNQPLYSMSVYSFLGYQFTTWMPFITLLCKRLYSCFRKHTSTAQFIN